MSFVRMKPPAGVTYALGADDNSYYVDEKGYANVDSGSVTKLTAEGWVRSDYVAPPDGPAYEPVMASKTVTGRIGFSAGSEDVAIEQIVSPENSGTIQGRIDSLNSGELEQTGGAVRLGTGVFYESAPITITSGSSENIRNVDLSGSMTGTVIDFDAGSGDGIVADDGSAFLSMRKFVAKNATGAAVKLKSTVSKIWNHVALDSVRLSFSDNGLLAGEGFMGAFRKVFASHNTWSGLKFTGPHTSLHFDNSYADANGGHGFEVTRAIYSAFTACASDHSGLHGYWFGGCSNVALNGTGAESNGRSGFAFEAGSSYPGVAGSSLVNVLDGCLSFDNNQENSGFPNHLYIKSADGVKNTVIARGNKSYAPANGAVDVFVDGVGAVLIDESNDFPAGVVARNGGYIVHVHQPIVVRNKTVASATPVVALSNMQGNGGGAFGGTITVLASPSDPSVDSARNATIYQLLVNFGNAASIVEIAKAGLTTGDGANWPSFTWSINGSNQLVASPVGSTSGAFYFEILGAGFLRIAEI